MWRDWLEQRISYVEQDPVVLFVDDDNAYAAEHFVRATKIGKVNGDCPAEACNGFKEDESWKADDFGCGLERHWCENSGNVWLTSNGGYHFFVNRSICRAELTRSADNCNCASTQYPWPEVWGNTVERLTDIGCGCGVTS